MQASQADIIKMAMIKIGEKLKVKSQKSVKMILQVHDELVCEVPVEQVEEVGKIVREEMETVAQLSVPILADLKAGPNWQETEPLAVGS